jgi:hypothetical protein
MKPAAFSVMTVCGLDELDFRGAQGVTPALR